MKYRVLVLSAAVAAMFSASAGAADFSQYLSVKADYSRATDKYALDYTDRHDDGRPMDHESYGETSHDNAWGGSLAYGFDFGGLRTEAELNLFSDSKFKVVDDGVSGKVRRQSLMLNAYYDFHNSTCITPYVGAGIGIARLKSSRTLDAGENDGLFDDSDTAVNFAWQIGVGASWSVTDNVAFDAGYRYADYGKVKTKSVAPREGDVFADQVKARANEFYVGLRYTFR